MENNELSVNAELDLNELEEAAGGKKCGGFDKKPKAKAHCKIYQIVHGDTLTKIANRNNTTVAKIMAVNPELTSASFIVSGLYIYIPQ